MSDLILTIAAIVAKVTVAVQANSSQSGLRMQKGQRSILSRSATRWPIADLNNFRLTSRGAATM